MLTLAAPSLLDKNDEERPNAVPPAESREVMRGEYAEAHLSGRIRYSLFVSREAGTLAATKTPDAL